MDSLIPKSMSGEDWIDHIIDITRPPAFGKLRIESDTTERVEKSKMLAESIQAFMAAPEKRYQEKVQAFLKTSDLPEPVTTVFDMFTDTTNYDMGWEPAFKDASSRLVNGKWEIVTKQEMNTWRLIPEGDAVRINTGSATLVDVEVSKFGSGIGWTQEMIMKRQVGRMLDIAEDFRNTYWQDKADRHYSLLTNASHATRGDTGSDLASWIDDLNGAAYDLLEGVKDTRNLPAGTEVLCYAPVQAKTLINRALGELSQAFSGSTKRIEYNITPIYTFNSNMPTASTGSTYACLMVIPGHKIQRAEAMPVTFYSDTDILSLTFIQTAFSFYGAIVADTNQVLTFDLATA